MAGESPDAGRWTAARKASILQQPLRHDRAIVKAMSLSRTAAVFLNASAIGVYRRPWP